MMCVSSFRPLKEGWEFFQNQVTAKESWNKIFDSILLLGNPEPALQGPQTVFVPWEQFPRIKDMVRMCSVVQEDWCVILNADIYLDQKLREIILALGDYCWCLSSWRYTYDPKQMDFGRARITDNGIDFFAARPNVWNAMYEQVPETLRIGHPFWDTWMLSFFSKFPGNFFNLTDQRIVFHPKHEGRKTVHFVDIPSIQKTIRYGNMPRNSVAIGRGLWR